MLIAYCVVCRAKRDMKNARTITLKSGKQVVQGVCPLCGHRMFSYEKLKDALEPDRQDLQS